MSLPVAPAAKAELVDSGSDPRLKLRAWGLRFADPTTERAFRVWQRELGPPYVKFSAYMAFFVTLCGLLQVRLAAPAQFKTLFIWVACTLFPMFGVCLLVASRPSLHRFVFAASAFADTATGLLLTYWYYRILFVPDAIYGWVILVSFYAFLIFRFSPIEATLTVLPYLLFHQWMLGDAVHRQLVSATSAVWYTVTVWASFMNGLLGNILIDRTTRTSYRQERIIEHQRAALERLEAESRAKEVHALNAELRRQVAERARNLADSLMRLSELPSSAAPVLTGEIIDGRYRVLRPLGQGGMGVVHEVERLGDGRRLALKVMLGVAHRSALVRFAREAQVAAQLDHPNVVATLDLGVTANGALFLVMELVTGTTLQAERLRYGDIAWGLPILVQVARALSAMHGEGIVHRDLKPSNVLLEGGLAKVGDFGIAALLDDQSGGPAVTRTGMLVGTPQYMAPELASGVRAATPAADIFSFGVLSYEILARRVPHPAPPVLEAQLSRVQHVPEALDRVAPAVPRRLARLIDACLHVHPGSRPTAFNVIEVLETVQSEPLPQTSLPDPEAASDTETLTFNPRLKGE